MIMHFQKLWIAINLCRITINMQSFRLIDPIVLETQFFQKCCNLISREDFWPHPTENFQITFDLPSLCISMQKIILIDSSKFPEIWWLYPKFIWDKYSEKIIFFFFSKFKLTFVVSALFHEQVLFFGYVFCWNNEYILDNINRIWLF